MTERITITINAQVKWYVKALIRAIQMLANAAQALANLAAWACAHGGVKFKKQRQ